MNKMLIRIANREDPDQTASSAFCSMPFNRELVFEILEHIQ